MQHFLGAAYKGDLNRTNPLGMSGELAEAFGHLMHNLWKGDVSVVAPRSFKAKVGGEVHWWAAVVPATCLMPHKLAWAGQLGYVSVGHDPSCSLSTDPVNYCSGPLALRSPDLQPHSTSNPHPDPPPLFPHPSLLTPHPSTDPCRSASLPPSSLATSSTTARSSWPSCWTGCTRT